MLFWSLQITVISIILIFLVHHLIVFFKSNLTVPKVKDLVNAPAQKYDDIYKTISSKENSSSYMDSLLPKQVNNNNNPEPKFVPNVSSMKDELKNFLKTKIKTDSGTTNIATLDSFGSNNFSYSPL
jgi:hypothetical protein|uniref:Uncharacterized protein n=1 Tax=viral metagenome TaxID=1070528 RepID=A0A6C0D9S8_9ZZZZ